MHITSNGVLNDTVGGYNHTRISVISPPQCRLTHHLVWYVHFIFYTVYKNTLTYHGDALLILRKISRLSSPQPSLIHS